MSIERVLIDKKGTVVTIDRAHELGVKTDILFVRNDKYILCAPLSLRDEAYRMGKGNWTYFYDGFDARPISEYDSFTKRLN